MIKITSFISLLYLFPFICSCSDQDDEQVEKTAVAIQVSGIEFSEEVLLSSIFEGFEKMVGKQKLIWKLDEKCSFTVMGLSSKLEFEPLIIEISPEKIIANNTQTLTKPELLERISTYFEVTKSSDSQGAILLKITDIKGKEAKDLLNELYEAGLRSFVPAQTMTYEVMPEEHIKELPMPTKPEIKMEMIQRPCSPSSSMKKVLEAQEKK